VNGKSRKLFWTCALTGAFLASCGTFLPPFTDEQRENNPIVGQLKNRKLIADRAEFFKTNSALLEKRRSEMLRRHPSLAAGPKVTTASGEFYWWEDLWISDFENSFVTQDLKPRKSCVESLFHPAEGEEHCRAPLEAFRKKWDGPAQSDVARRLSLRPTLFSLYRRTLWQELGHFDEAYRMQFVRK
jgi:hypothetical protein